MNKIDTYGNLNHHVRHYVKYVTIDGWVHTLCGRDVIRYHDADNMSEFYSDGERFSRPCKICEKRNLLSIFAA